MKSFVFATLRQLFAWTFALLFCAFLFVMLPALQYMNMHAPIGRTEKQYQVSTMQNNLPAKKKPKPKEQKAKTQAKSNQQGPKNIARSRFAMDLGVGGGSGGGGGVAIGGGGGGNEQLVYEEGETDVDATPIRQVAPKYPEEARKVGISGMVRVLITIDENGNVSEMKFLETPGDYGFDKSVREALSQWKFKPAEVGGVPVRQKLEQPFQF